MDIEFANRVIDNASMVLNGFLVSAFYFRDKDARCYKRLWIAQIGKNTELKEELAKFNRVGGSDDGN